MSSPNQKIVQIMRRTKRDKEHLYATINIDAARKAMTNLKGSGFKLWFYINKNQDGFRFDLSQKACADWGIKKDSYYSAVSELIEKNYLVPVGEGSNCFGFYENGDGEKPKMFSETPISESEITKNNSEKAERNNTNNTMIKQNITPSAFIHDGEDSVDDDYEKTICFDKRTKTDDYKRFGNMSLEKKKQLAALGF